jgi:hypothetical protein
MTRQSIAGTSMVIDGRTDVDQSSLVFILRHTCSILRNLKIDPAQFAECV